MTMVVAIVVLGVYASGILSQQLLLQQAFQLADVVGTDALSVVDYGRFDLFRRDAKFMEPTSNPEKIHQHFEDLAKKNAKPFAAKGIERSQYLVRKGRPSSRKVAAQSLPFPPGLSYHHPC